MKYPALIFMICLSACAEYDHQFICFNQESGKVKTFFFDAHSITIDGLTFDQQKGIRKLEVKPDQTIFIYTHNNFYADPKTDKTYNAERIISYFFDAQKKSLTLTEHYENIPLALARKMQKTTFFLCHHHTLSDKIRSALGLSLL